MIGKSEMQEEMVMKRENLRKLVLTALLTALVCVATLIIQIPSPMQGYLNLGDCFVLLSGWILGPWYGFFAGGVGSMLADLFAGYALYAPGTLIIKGFAALVAALLFAALSGRGEKYVWLWHLVSGTAGEIVMVAGYFGYTALLMGRGIAAAASIPGNIVQAAVGIAVSVPVSAIFRKYRLTEKLKER